MYENSNAQIDSDQESPFNEKQLFRSSSQLLSNTKDDQINLNLGDKSYDFDDESILFDNNKSMMLSRNDKSHNNSL